MQLAMDLEDSSWVGQLYLWTADVSKTLVGREGDALKDSVEANDHVPPLR